MPAEAGSEAPSPDAPPPVSAPRRVQRAWTRRRNRQQAEAEARLSQQLTHHFSEHWAQVREERRADAAAQKDVPDIHPGPSNFRRAQVPYGVDLAAAWAWRFVIIVIAGVLIVRTIDFFLGIVMPVVLALFITALVIPLVNRLARVFPRGLAALVVLLAVVTVVTVMLTFVTQQVVQGANDLSGQVVTGLDQIRDWLRDGPLHASDEQIDDAIDGIQSIVVTSSDQVVNRVQQVGATIGHIVAGFFIVLFATFFFLADGARIWAWMVRLFPRAARFRADASGRVAWLSLTQFVRATVLVALVDAIGVMAVAFALQVPFVAAIGVLVFLGGFVPMVGATVSGIVAVLVALVAQGPLAALLMLGGVIAVQQIEAHVLQPFLLGRMVQVHPLAVILAIAAGVYLAGIAGALVAVPLVAAGNAVVTYLASTSPGTRQETAAEPPPTSSETAPPA